MYYLHLFYQKEYEEIIIVEHRFKTAYRQLDDPDFVYLGLL